MEYVDKVMDSWGITRRIYTGFGIILGLLVISAGISTFATWSLSSVFTEYRGTARQSLSVNQEIENLFQTRMAALKYRIESSDEAATEVQNNVQEIIALQPMIEELFHSSPEWADRIRELTEDANEYAKAFNRMVELQSKREELVSMLVKIGPKARKQLTSVMETAYRDADADAAYYAGIAQEQLILGRFYTERYLLTNSAEAFNQANYHFKETTQKLNSLMSLLENVTRRSATTSTLKDVSTYVETLATLYSILTERNSIRNQQLDVIGPQMQKEYKLIIDAISERQNVIGPRGSDRATLMMILVAAIALVSFLVGGWLALQISKSVSNNIEMFASDMDALANDNFDIEIKGAEHSHELGLMAKALKVFRDNGLRVKALATEKKQADAIAAQERADEEARTKRMSELQSALGAAVDTAVAGDFSVRVPVRFEDEVLNNLAEGVNLLLETTERGLNETVNVLAAMSQGDLTARIKSEYKGAFDKLKQDANKTNKQLASIITKIKDNASSVNAAAGDISVGNNNLSKRTEAQAANLEETSSRMQEMTESVKQNADNALEANQFVINAQKQAQEGVDIVSQAVTAMHEIDDSSKKITQIINVINEIAFQTNLLALNASVEAARAGEHGRGFAVVASEVRELAGRSATAAKEIEDLISDSSNRVGEGSRLVNQSGQTLQVIMDGVKKVTDIVASIAAASQEQASGIEQVNKAIAKIDNVTQQNAALVEEAAASAEAMNGQSNELNDLVEFFTFNEIEQEASADVISISVERQRDDDRQLSA